MKIAGRIIGWALCGLPLLWGGCADSWTETEEGMERMPLSFSVAGGVSVDVVPMTRAEGGGEEERQLGPGEEVGLYVMLESDYERARLGLPLQGDYRYVNVRGTVLADGSISVTDTVLYYPLGAASSVAVVAYAPYRENVSDSILYQGEVFSVAADQVSLGRREASDLRIGVPTGGNPFSRPAAGGGASAAAVPLIFAHAYSRLYVTLELTGGEEARRCEEVQVELLNAPLKARVHPLTGEVVPLAESESTMLLMDAPYAEGVASGDAVSFQSSSIVFPREFDELNPPQFAVTLRGRTEGRDTTILRTDWSGTAFESGRDVRYKIQLAF